jgi:2,3-bisphosphoglycerate-independent phosphoglycerate mutase
MRPSPMHLLFLFVDGVGVGAPGSTNPFSYLRLPALAELAGGQALAGDIQTRAEDTVLVSTIDATLGVEGLPQSGTGQASLFTGLNCAAIAGRHFGPFPHSSSRPFIEERNLLGEILARGASAAFANAYPDRFFSYVETTNRWTVTTLCCRASGVELRGEAALAKGKAIPANLTGEGWPGDPFSPITEETAADRLLDLAHEHSFTLFEYYLTDKAGHGRGNLDVEAILSSLDRFLARLLDRRDESVTLVITSDHGNAEDMSTRSHTRNQVPLLVRGPGARHLSGAASLLDVAPGVLRMVGTAIQPAGQ